MPSISLRNISSDLNGVKNTYSSWNTCMTKAYCKWPAIAGIIIGSLICFSLLWCLFRCLCCGVECCCGCLSCCNACCPSPRRKHRNDGYHQQPPPPPQPVFQPYPQYQSPAPPQYAMHGGYRGGPQTATFDAPSKSTPVVAAKYNEDALPVMPSWENATSRRVEQEDVELEKLDHPAAQQQSLLPNYDDTQYYGPAHDNDAGDMGAMHAIPYQDYRHEPYAGSPGASVAQTSTFPPTYHTTSASRVYEPAAPQRWSGGYAESAAPSYHTNAPTMAAQQSINPAIGRKPVQGSWRDV